MSQIQKLLYLIIAFGLFFVPINVLAQSSSTNYKTEETFFGTGGDVDSTSTNFRSRQSAGALGVGDASSTNFRGSFGNITPSEPFLEMTVSGAAVDLGTLSTSTTSFGAAQGGTCSCSFTVRSYLSSQYSVINFSQPMVNESGITMTAKTVQAVPSGSTSVEEFGMNLVANTTLASFGADPKNVRDNNIGDTQDNSFADGKAAAGYQTTNQFKWGVGDTIASSPATSGNQGIGQTNYTISYIAKIKDTSAAGNYTLKHVLVAVPVY